MSLKLSQVPQFQLTLTPALRLSLEVLQLPLMQLEVYLNQQLEENPVLEMNEPSKADEHPEDLPQTDRLSELDESVRELWRQADGSPANSAGDEDLPQRELPAKPPSLHEHVLLQLRCLHAAPERIRVGEAVLGWLDSDGYLRTPLEEIANIEGVSPQDVEQALLLIHRLEPPGVGARHLAVCLLIQLTQRGQDDSLAARIVRDHFDLFAKRKTQQLASRTGTSLDEILEACRTLSELNPKPARNFATEGEIAAHLIPDVIVRCVNGEFQVELNDEKLPRISLSQRYRSLLRSPSPPPEAKQFIRQKMRQAVWLLKAVNQRHKTLLTLARSLVDLEHDYFLHGVGHMKALTQETLAQAMGCHASTISRAIAGKSIQTPYGVLPLDAFFGGGIAQPDRNGSNVSPRTIQAEIQSLIAVESPSKPLSDQAIQKALHDKGYPLARRTVAKYRAALKVLPAHLRRKCF